MIFYGISLMVVLASAERITDISDEYIYHINRQNLTWKAGRNGDKSIDINNNRKLLGNVPDRTNTQKFLFHSYSNDETKIPKYSDARKQWSKCASVTQIRSQGNCRSCWGCQPYYISPCCYEIDGPYKDCCGSPNVTSKYKSGGYMKMPEAKPEENHAVNIIGWGEYNNTAFRNITYWRIASSWNEFFGENGFFKILSGKSCDGIGIKISAVLPKFSDKDTPTSGETSGHDFQRFALSLLTTLICFMCCR